MGQHGIGKTAILEWSYDYVDAKKAFVSATWTTKDILKEICSAWCLKVMNLKGEEAPKSSWQVAWMHEAILGEKDGFIFVDDIQSMTATTIQKFKAYRDRFVLVCSAVPPIRKEEMKRMLFGLQYITVKPIPKKDMIRIGKLAAVEVQSKTPVTDAVHASRGIPAHLLHALRGEVTPDAIKGKNEEIDISPIFIIVIGGIVAFRSIGRSLDSTSLTMLGGLGTAFVMVFRYFLFKGMGK